MCVCVGFVLMRGVFSVKSDPYGAAAAAASLCFVFSLFINVTLRAKPHHKERSRNVRGLVVLTLQSGRHTEPVLSTHAAWLVQCLLNRSDVSRSGSVRTIEETASKLQQECAEIRFAKFGGLRVGVSTFGEIPSNALE